MEAHLKLKMIGNFSSGLEPSQINVTLNSSQLMLTIDDITVQTVSFLSS